MNVRMNEPFTHRKFTELLHTNRFFSICLFYTQMFLHSDSLAEKMHTDSSHLRGAAFTPSSSFAKAFHKREFAHRSFYTQRRLHRETLWHRSFICTLKRLLTVFLHPYSPLHAEGVAHMCTDSFWCRKFYAQKALHRSAYTRKGLLHTVEFIHRIVYTQKHLQTESSNTQKSLYTLSSHSSVHTQKHVATKTECVFFF